MRIAVGLLACLGAGALTFALADPSTEGAPTATAAPAAPAATTPAPAANAAAAAPVVTVKADIDKDTQHFLALGYKPEMRRGEQIYCRKETALGSRLTPVKNCGTIEQLKLNEQRTKSGVSDAQRQQVGISAH